MEKLDLIVWLVDWLITGALYKKYCYLTGRTFLINIEMEINLEEKNIYGEWNHCKCGTVSQGWREWRVSDVRVRKISTQRVLVASNLMLLLNCVNSEGCGVNIRAWNTFLKFITKIKTFHISLKTVAVTFLY